VLSNEDLENDCLNFLRINGQQVRAARLFLGREHEIQVNKLSAFYDVPPEHFMNLKWDLNAFTESENASKFPFVFDHLTFQTSEHPGETAPELWIHAYYQLMKLLIKLQIEAIHRAAGSQDIPRLIVEGGFTHNEIFIEL